MSQDAMSALCRLYEKIERCMPQCPEGCHKCCGPVAVSKTEAEAMGLPKGRLYTLSGGKYGDTCEFVDPETGKCRVYDKRPFICRMFNTFREGVFSCVEKCQSGNFNTSDSLWMFDEFARVLKLEGLTLEDYERTMDAVYDKMKQREIRMGWRSPS